MQAIALALRTPAAPPVLTRVVVQTDIAAALPAWRHLMAHAPCSPYQTDGWLLPWITAQADDMRVALAFGHDRTDQPIALLPLGLTRRAGVTVAQFLGGRDSNTGLGLFDPEAAFEEPAIRWFLRAVAGEAGIDLFILRNQPAVWSGQANPLAELPHAISPSRQHETDLGGSAESYFAATLSGHARKHIRQKEAKLAAAGPVAHDVAATPVAAEAIAGWLLARRGERFGRDPDCDDALRRMLVAASPQAVELHALSCGPTIVAALAVATHAGRMSGMLLSFDPGWARCSPGELLIARVVADACHRGFTSFDLGVGEARYKDTFCPRAEPLFDTILGVTPRGRVAASAYSLHGRLKRRIKTSRRAWAMVAWQRAMLRRLRGLAVRKG